LASEQVLQVNRSMPRVRRGTCSKRVAGIPATAALDYFSCSVLDCMVNLLNLIPSN